MINIAKAIALIFCIQTAVIPAVFGFSDWNSDWAKDLPSLSEDKGQVNSGGRTASERPPLAVKVQTGNGPSASQVGLPESDRVGEQSYKIGVGDLLQVEVYDEEDLTKEVRVLTDGYISFPLLGSVKVEGRTVKDIEDEITKRLAQKYLVNPQVTVFVKEFSHVFVFGEVKSPGSFPIFGRLSVFEAVTLAGGFTETANASKVKVIRREGGQEVTLEVDIDRLTKKGDTSQDIELQANDRIIVPRGFF